VALWLQYRYAYGLPRNAGNAVEAQRQLTIAALGALCTLALLAPWRRGELGRDGWVVALSVVAVFTCGSNWIDRDGGSALRLEIASVYVSPPPWLLLLAGGAALAVAVPAAILRSRALGIAGGVLALVVGWLVVQQIAHMFEPHALTAWLVVDGVHAALLLAGAAAAGTVAVAGARRTTLRGDRRGLAA
jgi:hypothetical protein